MKRGYYEYKDLCVFCQEGDELPQLSEDASELLSIAFDAGTNCPGWEILPARAKIALLMARCIKHVIIYGEGNPAIGYIWELINLLDTRVMDVYPFRDRIPDRILDNRKNAAVTAVTPEDHATPDYVRQQIQELDSCTNETKIGKKGKVIPSSDLIEIEQEQPSTELVARLLRTCELLNNPETHYIGYQTMVWGEGWLCKFKLSCQPLGKPYWEFIGADRITLHEWQVVRNA